jgi:hypothetical protein
MILDNVCKSDDAWRNGIAALHTKEECTNNWCIFQFTKIIPNIKEQMPICGVCKLSLKSGLILTRNRDKKLIRIISHGYCENGYIMYIFRDFTHRHQNHAMVRRSRENGWIK